ncbi:hypothetical protein L2E82_09208 [Cichorium intybus]|uniref:Uncharacterized protein n=1 Tax=Cichorium intybus TaxID=13427 RepID=A0ACB9G9S9_CICIN|nr:hypothetical protein L2E82_09208 [Cichorium intybus]
MILKINALNYTGSSAPKQEPVKKLPGGKERQEVIIEKVKRNKRKSITTIKGLELFGIKVSDASKNLGNKFPTGACVVKGPTEKEQIDVQGDIAYDIHGLMSSCVKFGGQELVMEKAATSGTTEENTLNSIVDPLASFQATTRTVKDNKTLNSNVDPQASFQSKTPLKDDEDHDAMSDDDGFDQDCII